MQVIYNTELNESILDWPVHMQRAMDLACNVLTAKPNPRVGCVITRNNTVVAEGWHVAAGQAHAEIMALENARESVEGGIAFVSLEPCNHFGRTGPCTEAFIAAGVGKVVIAMLDPDPRVAGQGMEKLQAAGIDVFHMHDMGVAATRINSGFVMRHEQSRPFVRMKMAMSLDGRTALANGDSKWISAEAARADVQRLRAASSAVITGIGTVLADDPRLTVRIEDMGLSEAQLLSNSESLKMQPVRVILDRELRTPAAAKIFGAEGKVIIFGSSERNAERFNPLENVDIRTLARATDSPAGSMESVAELSSVLESLAVEDECNEVLLEAGPTLCGAFLKAGLVDEIVIYIAPKLLGSDARPLLKLEGVESLAQAVGFRIIELSQIGSDIKAVLQPA